MAEWRVYSDKPEFEVVVFGTLTSPRISMSVPYVKTLPEQAFEGDIVRTDDRTYICAHARRPA